MEPSYKRAVKKAISLLFVLFILPSVEAFSQYNKPFIIATPVAAKLFPETVLLVKSAYNNIGIDVDISYMPTKRSLYEAANNQLVDAELARIEFAQGSLPDYIRIREPLFSVEVRTYTLKQKPIAPNWEDLKQLNVVSVRGFVGINNELNAKGINFYQIGTIAQALEVVRIGRFDVAILPSFIEGQKELKEFQYHTLKNYTLFHYIHKRHQNLVPKLNKALQQLKSASKREN